MPVTRATFIPVDELPDSERGTGGFGSTGYTLLQSGERA
jgi:dUTP pyrophosphatase